MNAREALETLRVSASMGDCDEAAVELLASTIAAYEKTFLAMAMRQRDRAVYLAEHLWQMIPQEVWREHGAEWMGQYEGDYHAEKVREELAALVTDRWSGPGLLIEDATAAGLLQQALDLYAKEDDLFPDIAVLVEQLRERLVAILG